MTVFIRRNLDDLNNQMFYICEEATLTDAYWDCTYFQIDEIVETIYGSIT